MPPDPEATALKIAEQLRERGHPEHAAHLRSALPDRAGIALLHALQAACQTILTAIEAIDPVCATIVDELRLEVDKRIKEATDHH